MSYKFEQLDVWKLALEYIDVIYKIAESLPRSEEYNLKSQIIKSKKNHLFMEMEIDTNGLLSSIVHSP
jgi:hypothetical protein